MFIPRKAEKFLKNWKERAKRKPLIVRGARQTGKSWLVEEFGKNHFEHLVVVNLEKEGNLRKIFERESEIKKIVSEIELLKGIPIISGKTILFIDEIQQCPKAIGLLRYFYEDFSELHVIAAGSLLEFVLEKESLSFPVGRVEFLYLFPLCFEEFLLGRGEDKLVEFMSNLDPFEPVSSPIHEKLKAQLKDFFLVGGMPEATAEFLRDMRYKDCEPVWESIIETYRDDFKKYSKRVNVEHLEVIFLQAPKWAGQQVNLTQLGQEEIRAREVKRALALLERAMLVHLAHRIKSISFPMLPSLGKRSKMLFLDLGLVQYVNRISREIVESTNLSCVYKGGFAEQYVGQELLMLIGSKRRPEIFYWRQDEPRRMSEIDYIYPHESSLLPVEVKAGKGTTLASLHQFVHQFHPPFAVRIYDGELNIRTIESALSQANERVKYKLLSVPLYLTHRLSHFCEILKEQ
ncbi:MAG: AAA family ATPase [Pseudomonadota bacterium]